MAVRTLFVFLGHLIMAKIPSRKSAQAHTVAQEQWYEFRRQLEYKLARNGGMLVAVPPQYTSQKRSKCGHVHKDNRLSQSNFTCVACGHHDHADVNAALNILAAGHAVIACGGAISQPASVQTATPVKQEPAEEILVT
jgi:putative transposase